MANDAKADEMALTVVETGAPVPVEDGEARPNTLAGMYRLAEAAVKSGLFPVKTATEAFVLLQAGAGLGFHGYSAFQFLYPVQGRARLTPAGAKAIALASGQLEDVKEELAGEGETREAIVTVKRRSIPTPIVGRFSMLAAKRAKLASKDNYQTYPDRMLLARARGFAFMDAFPDLCGGMQVREKFDLEPGEAIGVATPVPAERPKTGADPLLAKLGVSTPAYEFASHAEVEVQPYPSHAEADKAIAESEK